MSACGVCEATSGPLIEWRGFAYCLPCCVIALEFSPAALRGRAREAWHSGDDMLHDDLVTQSTWLESYADDNPKELPSP